MVWKSSWPHDSSKWLHKTGTKLYASPLTTCPAPWHSLKEILTHTEYTRPTYIPFHSWVISHRSLFDVSIVSCNVIFGQSTVKGDQSVSWRPSPVSPSPHPQHCFSVYSSSVQGHRWVIVAAAAAAATTSAALWCHPFIELHACSSERGCRISGNLPSSSLLCTFNHRMSSFEQIQLLALLSEVPEVTRRA